MAGCAGCRAWSRYRRYCAISAADNRKSRVMITRQVTPRSRPMRQKPTVLAREIVASSRLFRVEELQLRFSNGVERTYERLVGKGVGYGAGQPRTQGGGRFRCAAAGAPDRAEPVARLYEPEDPGGTGLGPVRGAPAGR